MAEKLARLPLSSSNARAFARMMLSGAMEVEIDKQGRALLPQYLRDYAGIEGDVTVAGLFNRVEIWDRKTWTGYSRDAEQNSGELAEKLTEWEI